MLAVCSTLVLVTLLSAAPQGPDRRAEAERLARAGNNAAALAGFQAIAAANPDDLEARIWIGRLHAALGHPQRAIDVFRSVLAVRPDHVQALVELGNVLVTTARYDDAATALDRAEAMAPDNPAVLTAQGRLHGAAGQRQLADAYFLRAQALAPDNLEARVGARALQAANAHRVEGGYAFEDFDHSVPSAHAGHLSLNLRASDRVRVFTTAERQRKFSTVENRGGGGGEFAVRPDVRVTAGGLFAGDTTVLPRADVFGSVAVDAGRATWSAASRYAHFATADLWLGGPGVLVRLPRGVETHANYFRSITSPHGSPSLGINSGTVGLSVTLPNRLRLLGDYTRGIDHPELLSVDRLGRFHANTWTAAVDFWASSLTSVTLAYDYQDGRPDGLRLHRAGIRLMQRF